MAHRSEFLGGVAADKAIDLQQFLVGEAEIGLAHRLAEDAVVGPSLEEAFVDLGAGI
eukprot:gene49667-67440_t